MDAYDESCLVICFTQWRKELSSKRNLGTCISRWRLQLESRAFQVWWSQLGMACEQGRRYASVRGLLLKNTWRRLLVENRIALDARKLLDRGITQWKLSLLRHRFQRWSLITKVSVSVLKLGKASMSKWRIRNGGLEVLALHNSLFYLGFKIKIQKGRRHHEQANILCLLRLWRGYSSHSLLDEEALRYKHYLCTGARRTMNSLGKGLFLRRWRNYNDRLDMRKHGVRILELKKLRMGYDSILEHAKEIHRGSDAFRREETWYRWSERGKVPCDLPPNPNPNPNATPTMRICFLMCVPMFHS